MPTAVGSARRFVRYALWGWRTDAASELTDVVELVTSELVTNAVRATGVMLDRPSYVDLFYQRLNMLVVRLRLAEPSLFVEVWDAAIEPPVMHEPALDEEAGRGLFLVGQVSKAWGYHYPSTGGKFVWAELTPPGT